jgi:hypothetical protein
MLELSFTTIIFLYAGRWGYCFKTSLKQVGVIVTANNTLLDRIGGNTARYVKSLSSFLTTIIIRAIGNDIQFEEHNL